MSSLPTPPLEDHKSHTSKRVSKVSKSSSRTSKRAPSSPEHTSSVVDGRHKRVWKACERCRMKKTKCDGESPCKRCKDDGLVCTAGSRKKTEFKQLPRGYAEVLENTQYALIATVQKLYTMLRNGESWELGEPEMNDRGQPVIHDIASKLGCIRPSPDLPFAFPEHESDFAELQAQLQQARSEMGAEGTGSRKGTSSIGSPAVEREDRASSVESEHSQYNQLFPSAPQQQQQQTQQRQTSLPRSQQQLPPVNTTSHKSIPTSMPRKPASFDERSFNSRTSFDTVSSVPSPVYSDFPAESPIFQNVTPFSAWSGGDDFLGQPHALDLAAQYMRQSHSQNQTQYNGMGVQNHSPLSTTTNSQMTGLGLDPSMLKAMALNDCMNFNNGTIRPGMLDCNTGYDLADPLDTLMYGVEFDGQVAMI